MAIIKVDTSDGIKEFQISGDAPTETERERIMQIVSPTEQLGQMKSIEGAGEKFASKFDEGFDYETGADSGLRAKVSFGETDGEQEKILRDQVGVGGYTKDSYGRLALTPEGQRVRGMENISDKNIILEDEGFSFGDVADLAGLIPETAGAVIGAILTAPGIITSAFGAAAGAAAGQYLEEGIETLLGIQQQSFGEVTKDALTEAALAGTFELGGALIFKAGRAIVGGVSKGISKGTKLNQISDDALVRGERLVDEGYAPSLERLGAPGMVGYQQKFAENVLRDKTRIELNLGKILDKADTLKTNLGAVGKEEAGQAFSDVTSQAYKSLKQLEEEAADASIKAVKESIDYIEKATVNGVDINEQLLLKINKSFSAMQSETSYEIWQVDDLLSTIRIGDSGTGQTASILKTSDIKNSVNNLMGTAGSREAFTEGTAKAVKYIEELGETASFRQIAIARKQLNDALFTENALLRREFLPEINNVIKSLDNSLEATNLSDISRAGMTAAEKRTLTEASKLRTSSMNYYKEAMKDFEDLSQFGLIRSIKNLSKEDGGFGTKGKFELDQFYDRVVKSNSPQRLKQLFKTVGADAAEDIRSQLSRRFLEDGIDATGISKFGDATGKFSGHRFKSHIDSLGSGESSTGKILFGKDWTKVQQLSEQIAMSGPDKLDAAFLSKIKSIGDNDPLVSSLDNLLQAKKAFAEVDSINVIRNLNNGKLLPEEAVGQITKSGASPSEVKKIVDFFEKTDPSGGAMDKLRGLVVDDILNAVDGEIFSNQAAASKLVKLIDSYEPRVLDQILGKGNTKALKEFAKDIEFLGDVGKEGSVAAPAYTNSPIKKFFDIAKFKIMNMIGSKPENLKTYINMQKGGANRLDSVNATVTQAVNSGLNTLENVARVTRQSAQQAILPSRTEPESGGMFPTPLAQRTNNINVQAPSINVQPPSINTSIGGIDITQPGVGAALGINPKDQAIAGRSIPESRQGLYRNLQQ
jgi:hypothetical protein